MGWREIGHERRFYYLSLDDRIKAYSQAFFKNYSLEERKRVMLALQHELPMGKQWFLDIQMERVENMI